MHYQSHVHLSKLELDEIIKHLRNLVPTDATLKGTWLSRREFNDYFVRTKFTQEITIDGVRHIQTEDAEKVLDFAKDYCTCRLADITMSAPHGRTKYMLRRGLLKPAIPPRGIACKQLLVDRHLIESINYVRQRRCK
ncbi:hypothetical protein D9M68_875160 [compost metagenome]